MESITYKEFLKNFSLTSSGAIVNVILQLVFTPILARIFPPEAYGVAAIYGSIFALASVIIPLGYQNALMLPDTSQEYFALSKLILLLTVIGFLILLIPSLFFNAEIGVLFELKSNSEILYLIPVSILLYQLAELFNIYHLRNAKFKKISLANVTSNIISRVSTLAYGLWVAPSGLGMVLGRVSISISKLGYLSAGYIKVFYQNLVNVNRNEILLIAKKYRNYPTKILPSTLLNTLAPQIFIWILVFFFSAREVGIYSFAIALLSIPLSVMTEALRPVFFQKATELYRVNKLEELEILTTKIFKNLSLLASLPLSVIAVFSGDIFSIVFGDEWYFSGIIASYFSVTFFLRGISVPFSSIRYIQAREGRIFSINIILIGLKGAVFIYAYFSKTFLHVLLFESVLMGLFYLINCLDILKLIVKKPYKLISESMFYILICILVLWTIKKFLF